MANKEIDHGLGTLVVVPHAFSVCNLVLKNAVEMKTLLFHLVFLTAAGMPVFTQGKSADQLREKAKMDGFNQTIAVDYEAESNTTRIRGVGENFSQSEARQAGVRAINFAAGVIAAGNGLSKSASEFLFSFWILSEKPQFADSDSVEFVAGNERFKAKGFRYAARPRDKMEYSNLTLSRSELEKIATTDAAIAWIGHKSFTFTAKQLRLFRELLEITEIN